MILDGEHGQRQRYYYQARPGCHQEHHADGEDHRAYHSDRDPAEQPNQVVHLCKHAQHTAGATAGHGPQQPLFKNNRTRVIVAGRPLLAAAQHVGEVRDDLTLEQILDMIVAIATIHGDTGYTEPILQAALDGLRPPADAKPA